MPEDNQTPPPEWKYKEDFGIVTQLREVVKATKVATDKELAELRRRLDKLTYGS